jgi:hypothetical protein
VQQGPEANERLTATSAVALLLLLAVEVVTIVFLRPLRSGTVLHLHQLSFVAWLIAADAHVVF